MYDHKIDKTLISESSFMFGQAINISLASGLNLFINIYMSPFRTERAMAIDLSEMELTSYTESWEFLLD